MRIILAYLSIIALLVGCSLAKYPKVSISHDDLTELYIGFNLELLDRGIPIPNDYRMVIRYDEKLSSGYHGICEDWYFDGDVRFIRIQPASRSKNDLVQLVYHELAHCILDIQHNNALDSLGNPVSIMHEHKFVEDFLERYEYYVNELLGCPKMDAPNSKTLNYGNR